MRPEKERRPSWICRTEFERARFMDLNARLVHANRRVMLALVVLNTTAFWFVEGRMALIPALAGLLFFGLVQHHAARFARPELWVFTAMLGGETMIAVTLSVSGIALTPAMALMCWPVAGVAGRFTDRAALLGTAFAAILACATVFVSQPEGTTPNVLGLITLVLAFVAIHTASTVLRNSDVEHRGAAILDPLTGMLNRSALSNRTAEIEHQSQLTGAPVAVIVTDLDHFKLVNDTHGHATGDAVLQEVAYRLRKELRAYDTAYRLGGEEFVVLLLGGTSEDATATAERLRAAVASQPIVGLEITVSVGLAASAPTPPSSGTTCSPAPTPPSTGPRRRAGIASPPTARRCASPVTQTP